MKYYFQLSLLQRKGLGKKFKKDTSEGNGKKDCMRRLLRDTQISWKTKNWYVEISQSLIL